MAIEGKSARRSVIMFGDKAISGVYLRVPEGIYFLIPPEAQVLGKISRTYGYMTVYRWTSVTWVACESGQLEKYRGQIEAAWEVREVDWSEKTAVADLAALKKRFRAIRKWHKDRRIATSLYDWEYVREFEQQWQKILGSMLEAGDKADSPSAIAKAHHYINEFDEWCRQRRIERETLAQLPIVIRQPQN